MKSFKDKISIVLCGEAGQGIQSVEEMLTSILLKNNYNVYATKEYMSRVRGGTNSTTITVCSKELDYYSEKIDLFFPFSVEAYEHLKERLSEETFVCYEKELQEKNNIVISFNQIAIELGNKIYSNVIVLSFILGIFDIKEESIFETIENTFSSKGDKILDANKQAIKLGLLESEKLLKKYIKIELYKNKDYTKLLNGSQAIGLGALSAGCNFISSYPMTPGTGVLNFLAKHTDKLICEQAEDEISAINMGIGAWYAGAKAMVSTSGGGFSLMTEGVSLAGIIESPMVIHISGRPGPATGLPTRTEQADLNLALYSGHGEFPRIILAPGNIDECITHTNFAFYAADKFQVPVFILSDQYLVDTYYNINTDKYKKLKAENFFIKTKENYKRYDNNNLRGIPSYGDGLVLVDSDEHDIDGRITESKTVRTHMMNKRMKKFEDILKETVVPSIYGDTKSKNLVISWGSNHNLIKNYTYKDTCFANFSYLFPLEDKIFDLLNNKNIIVIENNYQGQFADLLSLKFNVKIDNKILKYDGHPFSYELLKKELDEILGVVNE